MMDEDEDEDDPYRIPGVKIAMDDDQFDAWRFARQEGLVLNLSNNTNPYGFPLARTKYTFWVTYKALKHGVRSVDIDVRWQPGIGTFFGTAHLSLDDGMAFHYEEDEHWHRTESGARRRAEQMRIEEIKALKEKLERLENMSFQENEA